MRKVIQLRGTNAVGKTTAVRQLTESGGFEVRLFRHGKMDVEYHMNDSRSICVLGRYDTRVCGGFDGVITDKRLLMDVIIKMLKELKPQYYVLEGVLYGVTFQFGFNLKKVCDMLGYHYKGLCLFPPLEVSLMRLYGRNGGKEIDVKSFQNKHLSAVKAYEKLRLNGVDVKIINTAEIPLEHMSKIIEDEL